MATISPTFTSPQDISEFFVLVGPLLSCLGTHLCRSPVLFSRLCRLLKHYVLTVAPSLNIEPAGATVGDKEVDGKEKDKAGGGATNSAFVQSPMAGGKPVVGVVNTALETAAATQVQAQLSLAEITALMAPVMEVLQDVMLPALSRIESNPALSALVWQSIGLLPFQLRFAVYDAWRGEAVAKEALGRKDR